MNPQPTAPETPQSQAVSPVCGCAPDTPVYHLCAACKKKRTRIRDRLNHRKNRGRAAGVAHLGPETVAELVDTFESLAELAQEIPPDQRNEYVQRYEYAIRQLRRTLDTALATAREERIEIERPVTQYPGIYTPRRTKAIGTPARHPQK